MSPDKPDSTGHDGRKMEHVFGFCESFGFKDAENLQYFETETTTMVDDEIIIDDLKTVPLKKQIRHVDDDLTSLSWLHQQNLLKGLEISQNSVIKTIKDKSVPNKNLEGDNSLDASENTSSVSSLDDSLSQERNEKINSLDSPITYNDVLTNEMCFSHNTQENSISFDNIAQNNQTKYNNNYIGNLKANINLSLVPRNKHPNHVPYDPYLHRNCKPPYSFSCLIFMAIEDSPVKALPVKEVYAWILEHFPYFRNATPGWKNSVRHNLSLNKCFRKVEKSPVSYSEDDVLYNLGKGSLWMVDVQYRPNLLQALSRSPYPPLKLSNLPDAEKETEKKISSGNQRKLTHTRLPDPALFPYLSKRLASSNIIDNSELESDSDVDAAAAAMMSFKHGPIISRDHKKKQNDKMVPVITRSSIEDHTYSLITSVRLYERRLWNSNNTDYDEQRKIAEGAHALLNLAGVSTNLITNSLESQDNSENNYFFENKLEIGRILPNKNSLEKSPLKKRRDPAVSIGEAAYKQRKIHPWQETWNDKSRYMKQVRG